MKCSFCKQEIAAYRLENIPNCQTCSIACSIESRITHAREYRECALSPTEEFARQNRAIIVRGTSFVTIYGGERIRLTRKSTPVLHQTLWPTFIKQVFIPIASNEVIEENCRHTILRNIVYTRRPTASEYKDAKSLHEAMGTSEVIGTKCCRCGTEELWLEDEDDNLNVAN